MKNLIITLAIILSQAIAFAQCPPGSLLIFSSQGQIDDFAISYPNCTEFDGGITITGTGIMNLHGLGNLTHIGGDLNFLYTGALSNLMGLEDLTSVGGSLMINENYGLTSLLGLNSLSSIGGDLIVYNHISLNSLNGLPNLATVGGMLIITHNSKLSTINGLNNLISVGNAFEIADNPLLTSISGIENLASVGGEFWIQSNDILNNLDGLDGLTSVGGELSIISNYALTNVMALEALSSIGGELIIQSNFALTSLTGLDNIDASTINNLKINSNTSLGTCEVLSICEYLGSPNGTILISNNATGCSNQQEVEDACEWVSISEPTIQQELIIYPNPASSSLTIELPFMPSHNTYMSISNTSGQKVITLQIAESNITVDISHLPMGIYFVKVWDNDRMMVEKVIRD